MIVKNEVLQLENCLKSIREFVEEIVIIDTGSTDGSQEIAKRYADIFEEYSACNNPTTGLIEDFSMARTKSLELATKKFVLWCDADDEIVGAENLNQVIANLGNIPEGQSCCVAFPYEYAYDADGKPVIRQYRERLITPKSDFHWVNPVHEVLIPINTNNVTYTFEELIFKHRRGAKLIEPRRNLTILEALYAKEGEKDARHLYYLGLEYGNVGDYSNMIKFLTRYLELSGWDDEKYMACLRLADYYLSIPNYEEAIKIALQATVCKEEWGEAYFILCKCYYFLAQQGKDVARNWQRSAHFGKLGLSYPATKTLLFVNPTERDYDIHRYLNVALSNTGDIKGALESVSAGLKNKMDDNLMSNKKIYEKFLARNVLTNELNNLLEKDLIKKEEYEHIVGVLDGGIELKSEVSKIVRNDGSLDVVFFVGDGLEVWTPNTVKKNGIGGSELMAIELSKRLASLGNKVRVFAGCGNEEGFYDGVEYIQSHKFRDLNCDVLIVSRYANMLDDQYNINAKLKLLWCHDVVAVNGQHQWLLKAHRILALSEWHKQYLMSAHDLHPDHILVTRNGIDLERFKNKKNRNQYKVINSSSPDRGWPTLLACWPSIKKMVPQAELHLFYGFNNWEVLAKGNAQQETIIQSYKDAVNALKDQAVFMRGRVSQKELAEEMLSSSVWAYPIRFKETSCISAMEVQAAGLGIITSSVAALNETVGNRGVLLDGDCDDIEYRSKFVSEVVKALNSLDEVRRISNEKYANEHFGLDDLSKEWNNMFKTLLEEISINPITPYKPTEGY